MTPEGAETIWGGLGAAVAAAAAFVWHLVRRSGESGDPVTSQLLNRIGELETSLASERDRSELLETQVEKLRQERTALTSRVTHLEGQVTQLTELVTKLIQQR